MITGITIHNFKSIREVNKLPLDRFHLLVGPNASGKSTFLDALHFVRDCLELGPLQAVEKRLIPDFDDLTFMRRGGVITIEMRFDGESLIESQKGNFLDYRIAIRKDERLGVCLDAESLTQIAKVRPQKPKRLLGKNTKGTDVYKRENGAYEDVFVFGMGKSTLAQTPPDDQRYPTANAVKRYLLQGVRYVQLNSPAMRLPCPATRGTEMELDGTNLARVVGRLRAQNTLDVIEEWTAHLRYALPNLAEIGWDRRAADNAEFLVLKYDHGLVCPSWLVSDGTLRMLALTLPAFLPMQPSVYMVEEPENGVHPKALEIILDALSSIPDAQVFIATHSPLVVQQVGLGNLLCFSSTQDGTQILPGPDHPILKQWEGIPDLATIFSSGILE